MRKNRALRQPVPQSDARRRPLWPENNRGPSGAKKPMFFPGKTGRSGSRRCRYIAGSPLGRGVIVRMPFRTITLRRVRPLTTRSKDPGIDPDFRARYQTVSFIIIRGNEYLCLKQYNPMR